MKSKVFDCIKMKNGAENWFKNGLKKNRFLNNLITGKKGLIS